MKFYRGTERAPDTGVPPPDLEHQNAMGRRFAEITESSVYSVTAPGAGVSFTQ